MVAHIEQIEEVIAACYAAAEANLQTPGRDQNVVVLDAELAEDVMITGDLHGNRRAFNLIRKVAALDKRPRRHLVLQEVCHGGPTYAATGGCMSHEMLENVARLKVQFPKQVHFILANHELAEVGEYPIQKNRQVLNVLFRLGMQECYGPALEKVREAYVAFIRSCPLGVRMPGGVFISHTLPDHADQGRFDPALLGRPLDSMEFCEQGDLFHYLWGRDYRPENAEAFAQAVGARVLINGHEPCPEGFHLPNPTQVVLDCCGPKASYAILPVGPEWTQAEVVARIKRLG